jgi:hypothetical protein
MGVGLAGSEKLTNLSIALAGIVSKLLVKYHLDNEQAAILLK